MLVGVDIGTQSLKAIVVDAAMNVLGASKVPYAPSFPRPLWAEQDPQLWLDALKPAIAQALAAAGLSPGDVNGMGVSGQLDGCIATGADGAALAPAIIWMDRRASVELEDLDPGLIASRSGLVPDATHMAAKIAWSRKHLPETVGAAVWHQPVSFVVEALTGSRTLDHSLASTTMLYSLADRRWDAELSAAFGIDPDRLPTIAAAASTAGPLTRQGSELTGLPEGIAVVVGTGDDFANTIGSGIAAPGTVGVTLGTGEAISALSDALVIDKQQLVETHAFPTGAFHLGHPGWLSGGAVTWFLNVFSIATAAELTALAGDAPAGSDGLIFLPALSGLMAPRWIASGRGAFYGMTAAHTKAHFARAVLEGTSFAMRDVVERFDSLGLDVDHIRIMGGGAASKLWAQIRADLCGRPVECLPAADTSALGAAALAAVATSAAADVGEASRRIPHYAMEVEPNAALRGAYDEAYGRYRNLIVALEPMMLAEK